MIVPVGHADDAADLLALALYGRLASASTDLLGGSDARILRDAAAVVAAARALADSDQCSGPALRALIDALHAVQARVTAPPHRPR